MIPYFILTGAIAMMALLSSSRRVSLPIWALAFFMILVFVGLRHHVGMDWNNYLHMIERVGRDTLMESVSFAEPGYALLLWVSAQLGWGVYGSNLVGTAIFCLGLFWYARTTPYPWIALTVAMPMLVIVVAMSANRQAVAIGILLWLVAVWEQSSVLKRVGLVLLASMFHTSALFFLIFVMADLRVRSSLRFVGTGAFALLFFFGLVLSGRIEYYEVSYLPGQSGMIHSPGAIQHVLFNGGPALLFLLFREKYKVLLFPDQLHRNMALLAVALLPAALIASTAASRLSLYLFPVAMYTLSAMPLLFSSFPTRRLARYSVVLLMLGVLYVWLGHANSSQAHLPYENILTTPSYLWRLCC